MKKRHQIPYLILIVLTVLILLANIVTLHAQTPRTVKTNDHNSNSYITMNLLSPANVYSPRWRIGYIKTINPKWKIGLDIGYGNRNLSFSDFGNRIEDSYKLWEVRPELYYIIDLNKKTIKYFSAEPFYINHKDVFTNGHYFPINGEPISYDKANFNRQKYGLNLKYGFFIYSKKRLGFNVFTGLGLRVRKNTYTNIVNPNIVDLGPEGGDMFGFNNYKNTEGSNFSVNFSLGIKLYFKVK